MSGNARELAIELFRRLEADSKTDIWLNADMYLPLALVGPYLQGHLQMYNLPHFSVERGSNRKVTYTSVIMSQSPVIVNHSGSIVIA